MIAFWILLVIFVTAWALFLIGMAHHALTRFHEGRAFYWQPTPRYTQTPLDHYKTVKMPAIRRYGRQRGNGK